MQSVCILDYQVHPYVLENTIARQQMWETDVGVLSKLIYSLASISGVISLFEEHTALMYLCMRQDQYNQLDPLFMLSSLTKTRAHLYLLLHYVLLHYIRGDFFFPEQCTQTNAQNLLSFLYTCQRFVLPSWQRVSLLDIQPNSIKKFEL